MGYRPFGRFDGIAVHNVGDQEPEAPEDLRRALGDTPSGSDYNRFERAAYRWQAHPRARPRPRRHEPGSPTRHRRS